MKREWKADRPENRNQLGTAGQALGPQRRKLNSQARCLAILRQLEELRELAHSSLAIIE
jgi:hypothetical protein